MRSIFTPREPERWIRRLRTGNDEHFLSSSLSSAPSGGEGARRAGEATLRFKGTARERSLMASCQERAAHLPWTALFLRRLARAGLVGLLLATSSCAVLRHTTTGTKSLVESLAGGGDKTAATNSLSLLQTEVMRGADQYVGAVAQATDEFHKRVGTTEARDAAQRWKLNEATVAYINATDENPLLGGVSMVVLASLSRMVVEDYWVGEKYGEAARPLLETQRRLESNAWSVVRRALTTNQQQELRAVIEGARALDPHMRYVSAIRLPELVTKLGTVSLQEQVQKPGSLFGLLYINPLAGLDPATQAIQQTRMLAQRMMYYAQRAPMLLSWQVELTTYQLAAQPEAKQVLTDVDDVAQSTKVFAKTAEGLPKLVNDQREAAINQLLAGVPVAGSNLMASLLSEEKKVSELLGETRQTLNAGGQMATALNSAIQSLDAFVHFVSPPPTNPPSAATNSSPFHVLDYGTAATQIGAAAEKLNTLLASAQQSLPQITQMSQQATVDAKAVVNHAFRLGLVLIGVLGMVSVLVVLACRRLGRKTAPCGPPAAAKAE